MRLKNGKIIGFWRVRKELEKLSHRQEAGCRAGRCRAENCRKNRTMALNRKIKNFFEFPIDSQGQKVYIMPRKLGIGVVCSRGIRRVT